MLGKSYVSGLFILLLLGALGGGATLIGLGATTSVDSSVAPLIVMGSSLGTTALVMLLNFLGLRFGKKSLGGVGMILSATMVALGFYYMTSRTPILPTTPATHGVIVGTLVATGIIGLIGSLGVAISA